MRNLNEARSFFRDLCTIREIRDMSDRWEMAKLIDAGVPYREISKKLKVSTTTVSRVALWLKNGMNGYRLAIDKLNVEKNNIHHRKYPSIKKGLR